MSPPLIPTSPNISAFAARTKKIRIRLTMVTLPFNHPLRIAEDIAVDRKSVV